MSIKRAKLIMIILNILLALNLAWSAYNLTKGSSYWVFLVELAASIVIAIGNKWAYSKADTDDKIDHIDNLFDEAIIHTSNFSEVDSLKELRREIFKELDK